MKETREESIKKKEKKQKPKKPDARVIQDASRSIADIKEYELRSFLEKQKQIGKLQPMPMSLRSVLPLFERYQVNATNILNICGREKFVKVGSGA
jgi:hypothetical protein